MRALDVGAARRDRGRARSGRAPRRSASAHGARDGERRLGQRERLGEPAPHHQRVGEVLRAPQRAPAWADRSGSARPRAPWPPPRPASRPTRSGTTPAGGGARRCASDRRSGSGSSQRGAHEIDRAPCVARLGGRLRGLGHDRGRSMPCGQRRRVDLRPQLEAALQEGLCIGEGERGRRGAGGSERRRQRALELVGHEPVVRELGGAGGSLVGGAAAWRSIARA